MDYKEIYESWLANPYFDEETKAELKAIADDDNEIKERFYQELEFGTAGLRGVIGAPHEHLYSPQGYTGTCKLYYKSRKTVTGRCYRIRFTPYVT